MSITELKQAVIGLTTSELAEISAFIAEQEANRWDKQIDTDFSPNGRLRSVLDEVLEDARTGNTRDLP